MTRGNRVFSVVVYLAFALLIGALFFLALILLPPFLILCLAVLVGFVLGRATKPGIRTDMRPLPEEK